ncbi:MAG: hypothetical protein ACK422_12670, partial [Burkholderiales bacterium]
MQAFYPPTLKHRLVLAALLCLVLLAHLLGLYALSNQWPSQSGARSQLSLQWQATAPPATTAAAAPAQAATRKTTPP